MAQKIHPISNKLGLVQTWNFSFSIYGQNFKKYTKFIYLKNYIFNYINRFCLKHNLIIESINIIQTTFLTNIIILLNNPLKNSKITNPKNFFFNVISKWVSSNIRIVFYVNSNLNNSSSFIINYINYLFKQKNNTPKKVLLLIYKVLKDQKQKTLVKYTVNGIKSTELKGFKLQMSGCFESSRNQMAKTIKCNFGTIPLTKLNGYIDYSKTTFFTKFGSCGLQIWLFYEIK